jgi:transcriptional regulator with XRE-family HTH domain
MMAAIQRWTGVEIKALRQAMRMSVRAVAAHLGVNARTVNKWEARGRDITLRPHTQDMLDAALRLADEEVQARLELSTVDKQLSPANLVRFIEPARDHFGLQDVEQLRRRLQDLFAGGEVSGASVDDWELTVARYGLATKDRPATLLLGDLAADIAELERTMAQCRSLGVAPADASSRQPVRPDVPDPRQARRSTSLPALGTDGPRRRERS